MRATTALAAAALLSGGALAPVAALAQTGPSVNQIVKSLAPTQGTGTTTRGIRIGGQQAASHAPSISLNVDFATGSATLTPQAKQILDRLGQALNEKQLAADHFRVEGHTDTVGSRAMNQALSERRAASVVNYLESKFSIAPSRLQAMGMGENDLLVPTPDNTPEALNRRVLVVNIGS